MSTINAKIDQLNEVDRFILLLLGANDSQPVPGSLHLQKELYLLQNLFPKLAKEVDYKPDFLGPHSKVVADELQHLADSELISAEPKNLKLTSVGKKVFEILERESKRCMEKIKEFKKLLNDLSGDEVLAFICFSYKDQNELVKESAKFQDLLLKRRNLAISIYQKDKISAQKAAQIAGVYLEDFLKELKNSGLYFL